MIKIEKTDIYGFEPAIRGMRNPKNSWDKSDSIFEDGEDVNGLRTYYHDINGRRNSDIIFVREEWNQPDMNIGHNDMDLMKRLSKGGSVHAKYRRMIVVWVDITAPLYWWKEFKTYRAGRRFGDEEPDIVPDDYLEHDIEMNSCSTMHKIHAKEFELDDFSHEHLIKEIVPNEIYSAKDIKDLEFLSDGNDWYNTPLDILHMTIDLLNICRERYLETKDKKYWWQMIQLLPSSYNQKRTVMLNYEVLHNMYLFRKDHKLDEWREFCEWIKSLPYSEVIV